MQDTNCSFPLTIGVNNGSGTFSGTILSGLSLTKAGAGAETLSGANTYTGGTTISGGTLQLGNGTPGNDGSINNSSGITNNATLVYNLAGSQTYGGVIGGGSAGTTYVTSGHLTVTQSPQTNLDIAAARSLRRISLAFPSPATASASPATAGSSSPATARCLPGRVLLWPST